MSDVPARLPRPLLAAAIGLPLVLVIAVLVAAFVVRGTADERGPLPLPPVPAPQAGSSECARLLAALPSELTSGAGTLPRRQLATPAPPASAAWGAPPVVLRCGLARPAELTQTSQLIEVSGVQWLELPGAGASTWVAVDRPVYVALTLPEGSGSGPLQDVSATVRATLPAREVDV